MQARLRFNSILALAGLYLLAVVAAGRFHDHPPGHERHAPCCAGHDERAHAPDHGRQGAEWAAVEADPEDCPVCQFLGQTPTAPAAADAPAWQVLVARVLAEDAPVPTLRSQWIHRSRAPPSNA